MRKTSKKSLRFLADENLGFKVAQNLTNFGFDIMAVGKVARGANDAEVLARGLEEERVIITTDKDFGYLVFKKKLATQGVILLRLKEESVENLSSCLVKFLNQYADKIRGQFSVITEEKVRIKRI